MWGCLDSPQSEGEHSSTFFPKPGRSKLGGIYALSAPKQVSLLGRRRRKEHPPAALDLLQSKYNGSGTSLLKQMACSQGMKRLRKTLSVRVGGGVFSSLGTFSAGAKQKHQEMPMLAQWKGLVPSAWSKQLLTVAGQKS